MAIETTRFDPAEFLTTPEAQIDLILDAYATGDRKYIAHVIKTVARAKMMNNKELEAEGAALGARAIRSGHRRSIQAKRAQLKRSARRLSQNFFSASFA